MIDYKKIDFSKVNPATVKKVKGVIDESKKHVYSVSRIYAAYNEVTGLNEKPESCPSCLKARAKRLVEWLDKYCAYIAKKDGGEVLPQYDNPDAPGYVAQAEGTVRYPMAEGIPFDFLPNDGTITKGTVKYADGATVKPGTYKTAEGLEIAVQVGSKATIKAEDEDLI